MAATILLDTSVLIELLRSAASIQSARLARTPADTAVVLSSIVAAELEEGFAASRRGATARTRFNALAEQLERRPFDFGAAHRYGQLRQPLRTRSRSIGPFDELVAAHALELGASLATLDVEDFSRVDGLRVEDWRAP